MNATVEMGATALLASFVAAAEPACPAGDRMVLERSLREWIGSALGGRHGSGGRALVTMRSVVDGGGSYACVGPSAESAPLAAWANAAMAASSPLADADDLGADGAIVWSALLAVEPDPTSLETLLDAAACGIRASHALVRAGGYRRADRGFDQRGVFGLLAAAIACSRLRGHDVVRARATISVAASLTGGLLAAGGSGSGNLMAATAARDGVLATLLAEHDISGAPDMLEGRQGFGEAYVGLAASGWDRLAEELGASPPLDRSLRALAFAGHIDHQRPLAALASLRDASRPSEVVELVVEGVPPTSEGNRFSTPQSGVQARLSLRYVMARMLVGGRLSATDFDDETVAAQAESGILDRIQVRSASRWDRKVEDPHSDAVAVRLRYDDGDTVNASVDSLPQTATVDELTEKWQDEARRLAQYSAPASALIGGLWPDEAPPAEGSALLLAVKDALRLTVD